MPRMTMRSRRPAASRVPVLSPNALVLSVCHEIGNLLAASRLTAHLLRRNHDPNGVVPASHTIEALSAQAGSLLALVRPLVDPDSLRRVRIGVAELLEGVAHGLADRAAGPSLQLAMRRGAPHVEADPDALHHTLLVIVMAACEAAGPSGHVEIAATRAGDELVIRVRDDGAPAKAAPPAAAPATGRMRRGRDLALALAETVLRMEGGRLVARSLRGRQRGHEVTLRLPAASTAIRLPAVRSRAPAASPPAARTRAARADRARSRSPRGRAARST